MEDDETGTIILERDCAAHFLLELLKLWSGRKLIFVYLIYSIGAYHTVVSTPPVEQTKTQVAVKVVGGTELIYSPEELGVMRLEGPGPENSFKHILL